MKSIWLRTVLIAAVITLAFALDAGAYAAIGTRGGGGANSARVRRILQVIGVDGATLKATLITRVRQIQAITPDTMEALKIVSMNSRGLIEDIEKSKYVVSDDCRDWKNIERAASTIQVNLYKDKKPSHPDICINLPMLASDNSSAAEIEGLLMHEHGRHFGFNDTDVDEPGVYPLALALSTWSPSLSYYGDVMTPDLNIGFVRSADNLDFIYIGTENPARVEISMKAMQGGCNTARITHFKKTAPYLDVQEGPMGLAQNATVDDHQQMILSGMKTYGGYQLPMSGATPAPSCTAILVVKYKGETRLEKTFDIGAQPTILINRARRCDTPDTAADYCF